MTKEELRPVIINYAQKYGLHPEIVYGICMTESSLDPDAVKVEPGFYATYTKPMNFSDTEEWLRATSWGLMQVMGQVARELGYKGKYFSTLCSQPEVGLDYGCHHLSNKIKKYGMPEGIMAYNSGSPRKNAAGEYVNQSYLDSVIKYSQEF